MALAWLMVQPSIVAPIASATSLDQFRDLVTAANLVLGADDLSELDTASRPSDEA